MKKILVVIILIAGIVFGTLNFHFILTDSGPKVLKKADLTLRYTFVDARGMKQHKLLTNPALLEAGLKDALN